MSGTMNHWPLLAAFGLASLVLAATPGPGVLYVVTRTLAQGRRAGLASVAGVAMGNLGNALGASLGLAALLAMSSLAFTLIKFAGAAYLLWLGISALRQTRATEAPPAQVDAPRHGRLTIMRDGFVVALLNPKTALFFAAFLPQFIDPAGSAVLQSAGFGAAFVAIAACTDTAYVLAAGAAAPALGTFGKARALGRYTSALVYLGLGLFIALTDPRPR
jgi:threonine/homoserine/homoserine lactone efflux protein